MEYQREITESPVCLRFLDLSVFSCIGIRFRNWSVLCTFFVIHVFIICFYEASYATILVCDSLILSAANKLLKILLIHV